MDLHGIVSGAIGAVNPFVTARVRRSTGYVNNPDATRTPTYSTVANIPMQVQALTYQDLMKLDGLNIQGARRAVYVEGFYAAVVRNLNRGGDLVVFPNGTLPEGRVWLVAQDLENWPDWCKFVLTLQVDQKTCQDCLAGMED